MSKKTFPWIRIEGWLVKNSRGEVTITEAVGKHFTKDFNKKLLAELLEASDCITRLLGCAQK